ncbi:unnamed protein product [Meganyctiphanes norvegica]|uniref:Uncharacterized protein n=1 Tax=Meganyctiphanes norvegica TaxID=48144 RepID=A0AAV2SFZ0_MEGNR
MKATHIPGRPLAVKISSAGPFGQAKDLWRPGAAQDDVWPSLQSHNETKVIRYTFVNLPPVPCQINTCVAPCLVRLTRVLHPCLVRLTRVLHSCLVRLTRARFYF